jgi:hypothetical protein
VPGLSKEAEHVEGRSFHADNRATLALAEVKFIAGRAERLQALDLAGRSPALVEVGKAFFKPALRAAGLPEALRLYDLRHTCASLPIGQGASVKAVQAQLGHATASITLDTSGHLFPSELEALADRLEQAWMGALANRERTQRGPAVVRLGESAGPRRGGGGIRTHGALSGPATFKVAAFGQLGHSSPGSLWVVAGSFGDRTS